ncbi:SseB family protein [Streptomyces sp. DT195]|uniref:SseB family protein n=1 Tax=Streptomyces sp. DT195 TaxID=3393419 RepID=UPI003CF5B207
MSEYGDSTADNGAPGGALAQAEVRARKREFDELLGEFRRTPVLVPLGDDQDGEPALLTADFNGIRFILAFSDEQALARYATARGESAREWTYQRVLGARLLDVAVPAAGVPCGVALDCADGSDGMVFPPVAGIVPDGAAVDLGDETRHGGAL